MAEKPTHYEKPRPDIPFGRQSSYQRDYPAKMGLPAESLRPRHEFQPPVEQVEGTSTYSDEYSYKAGRPAQPCGPKSNYSPPEYPIENETAYSSAFQAKRIEKVKDYRPNKVYRPPTEAMESATTYQDGFEAKVGVRTEPIKPQSEYQASRAPFGGTSEYNRTFRAIDNETFRNSRQSSCAPKGDIFKHRAAMEDMTETKEKYIHHFAQDKPKPFLPGHSDFSYMMSPPSEHSLPLMSTTMQRRCSENNANDE